MIAKYFCKMFTDILQSISEFLEQHDSVSFTIPELTITRKEYAGDLTLVTFPYAKPLGCSPELLAERIGHFILNNNVHVKSFNVIKGFLNIELKDSFWVDVLLNVHSNKKIGYLPRLNKTIMLEYCGPNTNKPLHLGHLRNIVLGWSMIQLLDAYGYDVLRANIINDRGVHICKSMYAWIKEGCATTPEQMHKKGDHFVGDYYIKFENILKEQAALLVDQGIAIEDARRQAPVMQEIQQMLLLWEQNDPEIRKVWQTMNAWVLDGFKETYYNLGIAFDKEYFESDTYLLGKKYVEQGLAKGIFYKKDDGSIWVDLTDEGLDHKLLLRADGTSVYITQDIGTAMQRYEDYGMMEKLIYTVGNEQEYHFKVLRLILKKLGVKTWEGVYHLSYGMVSLPDGKMKSREGTVVDADDMIAEMKLAARTQAEAANKSSLLPTDQQDELYHKIGLGALKYFLLRVNATSGITFNPKESIDLHGNTGPFIQYAYTRTQSIAKRTDRVGSFSIPPRSIHSLEKELIYILGQFENAIRDCIKVIDPSQMAAYVYSLAKTYNRFYQELPILQADEAHKELRLILNECVGKTLARGLQLLGIEAPDRM